MDVRAESVTSGLEPVTLDVSALWRQHYRNMVRLAFLLTGSQAHAEDLVQDAFVSLQRRRRPILDPLAYLRTCVVNRCRRWRGREAMARARTVWRPTESGPLDVSDDVADAVGRLPYKQRVAIVLRFHEDLSYAQIAEAMGCPVATARSHVHRGLVQLREMIEP